MGWTIAEFRQHFDRLFCEGMTWADFDSGRIHIDHILPASAFNLAQLRGVRAAWSLSNLRPAWAHENVRRPLGERTLKFMGPFGVKTPRGLTTRDSVRCRG